MRWFKKYWLITLIHIIFVCCVGIYGYKKFLYAGVEQWPSCPAEILEHSQVSSYGRTDRRYYGAGESSSTSGSVVYRYTVNDVVYKGRRICPNGGDYHQRPRYEVIKDSQQADGEVPLQRLPTEHRAYYHPTKHELAVLDPQPYSGIIPILLGVLTGTMVAIQHFLRIRA